jgi:hypothetical protein
LAFVFNCFISWHEIVFPLTPMCISCILWILVRCPCVATRQHTKCIDEYSYQLTTSLSNITCFHLLLVLISSM